MELTSPAAPAFYWGNVVCFDNMKGSWRVLASSLVLRHRRALLGNGLVISVARPRRRASMLRLSKMRRDVNARTPQWPRVSPLPS